MATSDTERSRWPVGVTILEIIDKIHDITIWKKIKLFQVVFIVIGSFEDRAERKSPTIGPQKSSFSSRQFTS